MLLSQGDPGQQQSYRRPLATVRQQSAPMNSSTSSMSCSAAAAAAPAAIPLAPPAGHCLPNHPLNFPQPKITRGRRTVMRRSGTGSEGGQGERAVFTLDSVASGRRFAAVKSMRDCQFGEVWQAVEMVSVMTARGLSEWVPAAGTRHFAIKELRIEKMIQMRGRSHEDPLQEVAALQYLSQQGHPNVLQCTEVLRDEKGLCIITPFCSGGEVFDIVADKGRFEEAEARSLFRQALDGLIFLKQHGVCHRDVSLENLMLDEDDTVKIIDMGLALRVPQFPDGRAVPLPSQGPCGKQFYMPPEILMSTGPFDGFAVDVWACGVMLFVMLTGVPPFELAMPSQDQRCRVVAVEQRLGELLGVWNMTLSDGAVELMQSCLTFDPSQRPSLEQLRSHPWVTGSLE